MKERRKHEEKDLKSKSITAFEVIFKQGERRIVGGLDITEALQRAIKLSWREHTAPGVKSIASLEDRMTVPLALLLAGAALAIRYWEVARAVMLMACLGVVLGIGRLLGWGDVVKRGLREDFDRRRLTLTAHE